MSSPKENEAREILISFLDTWMNTPKDFYWDSKNKLEVTMDDFYHLKRRIARELLKTENKANSRE